MTLQAFVPRDRALAGVVFLEEKDALVLAAGSDAFFAHFEALKGRERVEIVAQKGDTFRSLAKKHGLTMGMLERINQRSRSAAIEPGERLVVYVAGGRAPSAPEPAPPDADEAAVAAASEAGEADAKDAPGEDATEAVKPAVLRANPSPERSAPASGRGSSLAP
jgi:membrane-bound lytic murein transglycosylase D